MRRRMLAVLAVFGLLAAACTSGGDESSATGESPSPQPAATVSAKAITPTRARTTNLDMNPFAGRTTPCGLGSAGV